jgi:hypothetical protein
VRTSIRSVTVLEFSYLFISTGGILWNCPGVSPLVDVARPYVESARERASSKRRRDAASVRYAEWRDIGHCTRRVRLMNADGINVDGM